MGRGNECLFAAPGSHYQDGRRHAHKWLNPLKISGTNGPNFTKLGM